MKIKTLAQTAAMFAMAAAVSTALATPIPTVNITVNGDLSDWGVTLLNDNGSNILPQGAAGASSPACLPPLNSAWACEDSLDTAPTGGVVGPQSGGQDYDVEFLGAAVYGSKLFVGIASGLRPDNGLTLFGPGDLFIKVNGVAYVIEMGGGAGHTGGAPLGAQTEGATGSNYILNSNGTTAYEETTPVAQTVGSIWKVSDGTTTQTAWASAPTQWVKNAGAVSLGTATVWSTRDSLIGNQDQHAAIEVGIELGLFPTVSGPMTIDELRWDPSCFNDVLQVSGTIPAPSSLLLCLLGLTGFAGLRRRAQKLRATGARA